MKLEIRN
jgi:hypothetical protein